MREFRSNAIELSAVAFRCPAGCKTLHKLDEQFGRSYADRAPTLLADFRPLDIWHQSFDGTDRCRECRRPRIGVDGPGVLKPKARAEKCLAILSRKSEEPPQKRFEVCRYLKDPLGSDAGARVVISGRDLD